jgi:hypothetical protein
MPALTADRDVVIDRADCGDDIAGDEHRAAADRCRKSLAGKRDSAVAVIEFDPQLAAGGGYFDDAGSE